MSTDQCLVLKFTSFGDSRAIEGHIRRKFKPSQYKIRIERDLITATFNLKEDNGKFYESKIIRDISTPPNNFPTWKLASWIEAISPSQIAAEGKEFYLMFNKLTTFHFNDRHTVVLNPTFLATSNVKLAIHGSEIIVRVREDFFVIRSIDVGEHVLINETHDSFEIFLCLKNSPKFFHDNQRTPFDFCNRKPNLYLMLDKPIASNLSLSIRRKLEFFCSKVINVCNLSLVGQDFEKPFNMRNFKKDLLVKAWFSKHSEFLPPVIPNHLLKIFQNTPTVETLEILLNNFNPKPFEPLMIPDLRDIELPIPAMPMPKNFVEIWRLKVTPSRLIFMPRQPTPVNRILRYFPDPENFLIVEFVDEDDRNPWFSESIVAKFFGLMLHGTEICGRTFGFLGCSNSQLREGRCWFSCISPRIVYNKIGYFPNDWSAGRKLTRIALAFASSIETISLNNQKFIRNVEPDIESGGICFSDGIGRASTEVMKQISKQLSLPEEVSAFQIRVGGIKGVITGFSQEAPVTFRKSMKKFESYHEKLEILSFSRSLKMDLSRHVILLLSSFGISDEVFLELQFNELEKIIVALTDERKALGIVKHNAEVINWAEFKSTRIVREPIFRQILISNAIAMVAGITEHAHIPVEGGRLLVGVLDETGQLEYGEVYAHIVEENFNWEVEGRVIVYRNPCVLPSDIRILNARSSKLTDEFKSLYRNCLVFPSKGKSAHTQECSGGDLDGDLYYIVWDQRLVPADIKVPGYDVVEVKTLERHKPSGGHLYKNLIEFFCEYQQNNQLGVIANAHLSTADKFGFKDPRSVKLARLVTAETDAPKKGFTVGRLPKESLPESYPDYMQKPDKVTYRSETILGKLFRQANPILEVLLQKSPPTIPHLTLEYFEDQDSLESLYAVYCFEVKKIMESFELKHEVDLFSGSPQWNRGHTQTQKQKIHLNEQLAEVVKVFWQKWTKKFEKFRENCGNDQKSILEWYNKPTCSEISVHSFSLLALPHIVEENHVHRSISESINDSTATWVNSNKFTWLTEWQKRFISGKLLIHRLVGITSSLCGVSLLSLSQECSDINILAQEDLKVLDAVLRSVDRNAVTKNEPRSCISLTFDSYDVDVTNIVEKSHDVISKVFDSNPTFWPALRVIIEWAQTVRIIRNCEDAGDMTIADFCFLFIQLMASNMTKLMNVDTNYTLKRINDWMESVNRENCGNLIFGFFKTLANRKNAKLIISKLNPVTGNPLVKENFVNELRKQAELALYILVVHEGNIEKLFEYCTKKRLFKISTTYMDPSNITKADKQQKLKEIESFCKLEGDQDEVYNLISKKGSYYLEVSGDRRRFFDIENGLSQIHSRVNSRRLYSSTNSSFMNNGTLIIPEFSQGLDTEVKLKPYDSLNFHSYHTLDFKGILQLKNAKLNPNWRETEYDRYHSRFLEQIRKFRANRSKAEDVGFKHLFGEMKCQIRIGSHYFSYAPPDLVHSEKSIPLRRVETEITENEIFLNSRFATKIMQDFQKNNQLALTRKVPNRFSNTLVLRPLKEAKMIADSKKETEKKITEAKKVYQKNFRMRHTFYTFWDFGKSKTEEFAIINGFVPAKIESYDYHVSISVQWRSRDRTLRCDRQGKIHDFMNRKVRWFSSTFKRGDSKKGPDIRTYMEIQADLDDEESCLKTFIDVHENNSIFTEEFIRQINGEQDTAAITSCPVIPELFEYNWNIHKIRIHNPVAKFVNAHGDIVIQNNIQDGFSAEGRFQWSEHEEFEIRLKVGDCSDEDLCKRSYDLTMKLFNFTKF